MFKFFIFSICFFAMAAFGQEVVSGAIVTTTTLAPVAEALPSWMDALKKLSGLDLTIAITVLTMGLEIAMRVFKTTKPKSLLYMVANVLNVVGSLFMKLAEALDKVLQNLKDK